MTFALLDVMVAAAAFGVTILIGGGLILSMWPWDQIREARERRKKKGSKNGLGS